MAAVQQQLVEVLQEEPRLEVAQLVERQQQEGVQPEEVPQQLVEAQQAVLRRQVVDLDLLVDQLVQSVVVHQ